MKDGSDPSDDSVLSVQQQFASVLRSSDEIAAVLVRNAKHFSGERRTNLLSLGYWFQQTVTPEMVLRKPGALSICLVLLDSQHDSEQKNSPRPWQIEDAVLRGAGRAHLHKPRSRSVVGLLAYPLVLMLLCGLIFVALCLFLVPQFESMFKEFELTLSPATEQLFLLSHFVRQWGLALLSLVVVGLVAIFSVAVLRRLGRDEFMRAPLLQRWMVSSRASWAAWAWHVGLLLEAEVPLDDAVLFAGQASCKPRLKRSSDAMAQQIRSGSPQASGWTSLVGHPYYLLAFALQIDQSSQHAGLLQDVAVLYWDRDRNKRLWWLSWVGPATVCLVGVMVGLVVAALFMPLVQLISGLT